MSVKSSRGQHTSKPDLGTLVEEAADDLPSRPGSPESSDAAINGVVKNIDVGAARSIPASPISSTQNASELKHAHSEEGRSSYETTSSKFSVENTDEIGAGRPSHRLHCSSPSVSPQLCRNHRKSASVSLDISPAVDPRPNLELLMAHAAAKAATDVPHPPRRFSLMNLLNNVTAPMRRSRTAQGKGVGDTDRASKKEKQRRHEKTKKHSASPGTSSDDCTMINLPSSMGDHPPLHQPVSVPCSSFDVCNAPDNVSDVYRPASTTEYADGRRTSSPVRSFACNERPGTSQMECQLCYVIQSADQFPILTNCFHRPCRTCVMRIMESRIILTCPECPTDLHPNDIYTALKTTPKILARYEKFMIRRVLVTEADVRWCPAPDCDYAVIASNRAACPQLECQRPGCGKLFCYHCKGEWHPSITCDEARGQSVDRMFVSAANALAQSFPTSSTAAAASSRDLKACPRCGTLIVKLNDGSCNHMVCPMCQADFCWLCLKEISDLHYLSPTGCTFWGKKPWTRKKKLLWQVGTLIGAPVGIALIAGLAVPGIICGVPVFVGRKAYQRFSELSKGKRRLVTAASVAGSLVVSPVLAVMAVGVGVPIMLAYVYGVVPLSLCRNGGCGGGSSNDSDSNERAPRLLELAEDAEMGRAFLNNLRNMTSGDERSRLLKARDADRMDATSMITTNSGFSAFNVAPGTSAHGASAVSATGSLRYGSHGHGAPLDAMSQQSTLGVQTDQRKRKASVESCVNSIGEKINYESASTKAHAGSHYHLDSKSVNTVYSGNGPEVQSYCEENASVIAMSGSIDGKSLTDTASLKQHKAQRINSRPDRDVSPSDAM